MVVRLNGSAQWHSGDYSIPFTELNAERLQTEPVRIEIELPANRKRKRTGRLTGLADYD